MFGSYSGAGEYMLVHPAQIRMIRVDEPQKRRIGGADGVDKVVFDLETAFSDTRTERGEDPFPVGAATDPTCFA